MAQPQHKRKTKHRGNAAGMIETRGRTGHKLTAEERRGNGKGATKKRAPRGPKPPSWRSATIRAAVLTPIVFAMLYMFSHGEKHGQSVMSMVLLALIVFVFYIPAGFYMDRSMYQRRLRKDAAAASQAAASREKTAARGKTAGHETTESHVTAQPSGKRSWWRK